MSVSSRFWRCIAAPSPDGPRYSQGILRQLISISLRGGWETVCVCVCVILRMSICWAWWWIAWFVSFHPENGGRLPCWICSAFFFQMGCLSEGCSVWLPHQLAVLDSRWWVINYPKHLDDLHGHDWLVKILIILLNHTHHQSHPPPPPPPPRISSSSLSIADLRW